jgi:hypothetical protein
MTATILPEHTNVNAALRFLADLTERCVATFVETFVPAFLLALFTPGSTLQLDTIEKAAAAGALAGLAAVGALIKGLIAQWRGNHASASLLPATVDPTPTEVLEPTDALPTGPPVIDAATARQLVRDEVDQALADRDATAKAKASTSPRRPKR